MTFLGYGRGSVTFVLALWVMSISCFLVLVNPVRADSHLNTITIDGSINPASADFLIRAIEESEAKNETT